MLNIQNNKKENLCEVKENINYLKEKFLNWFIINAVPTWKKFGIDYVNGGFFEALDNKLQPIEGPRRTRVICRQIYVFIVAKKLCVKEDVENIISDGFEYLLSKLKCRDGFFAYSYNNSTKKNDNNVFLYEQAFVIFTLASLFNLDNKKYSETFELALNLLRKVKDRWFSNEFEDIRLPIDKYQTDPYMHLLEGLLLWEEVLTNTNSSNQILEFKNLSDTIVNIVFSKCSDKKYGYISEEYSICWSKLEDEFVHIEPGHQYEWSWLLIKWSRYRNNHEDIKSFSLRLIKFAERYGLHRESLLVVNSISNNFEIKKSDSKIWPQCERLKAWLAYYSIKKNDSSFELQKCHDSLQNLVDYLDKPFLGGWIECKLEKNNILDEFVKSSSLYHIVGVLDELIKLKF